ncbi:hypothetical protein [Acinetobacter bereziniae]
MAIELLIFKFFKMLCFRVFDSSCRLKVAVHDFLFSYTVLPKTSVFKKSADDMRSKIAEIKVSSWVKYTGVEVFSGELDLTGIDQNKRIQAMDIIKNTINEILIKNQCVSKVMVNVILMVDQLGKPMHFTIWN